MKAKPEQYSETKYGFIWNQCEVTRCCSHRGYIVLQIRTPRRLLDITITPSGLIRIMVKKNKEGGAS